MLIVRILVGIVSVSLLVGAISLVCKRGPVWRWWCKKFENVPSFVERINVLFYGVAASLIVPTIITFVTYRWVGKDFPSLMFIFLIMLCVCFSLVYRARHVCEKEPAYAAGYLYIAGFLFIFAVNSAVYATGGPLNTPYSFYYLFIPVITAIISTRLRASVYSAVLSSISFAFFLFLPETNKFISSVSYGFVSFDCASYFESVDYGNWRLSIGHSAIFIFYLVLTIWAEWTVERLPRET